MAVEPPVFRGTSRFELLRPLGEGGMGVVWEAFDRERNSRVALKTIRIATADSLARFKNEFRTLQDLQHPNLVRLDELLEAEGTWFFTMELVEGTDFIGYVRTAPARPASSLDGEAPLAAGSEPSATAGLNVRRPNVDGPTSPTIAGLVARRGLAVLGAPAQPLEREPAGFDELRLRAALRQLVFALAAVHDARKVHRDVKPGNILVTAYGRVVLLDFGLITDAFLRELDSRAVGTVSFMAPEQLAGEAVGPAADWYAVGVTLYLALTGRRPFLGSADQIAELKQHLMPLSPADVVEGVPEDLNQLCMDLLARDPRRRPDAQGILARLGAADEPPSSPALPRHAPFVGRAVELAALRQAFARAREGHAVTVLLHGESGVGKSALVKRFLDEVAGPRSVILAGRCYERESVPYKALDQVMDALARHLAGLPRAEVEALLPDKIVLVAEVFPTLRQVVAIEERAASGSAQRTVDPFQSRVAVFAALRDMWSRLGRSGPLVVAIDDLQWADGDSLALLAGLTRPPLPPAFLLCATVRTSLEAGALGPASLRSFVGDDVRDLQVDGLPPAAARELAESLLGASAASLRAGAVAAEAAAEAAGHPMFIEALVRHRLEHPSEAGAVRLDEALVARSLALGPVATQLLEFVCVAGEPIQQEVCAHAAGVPFGEFAPLVSTLRAANLVKTHGVRRADSIEPYHDRVRESVAARLAPEARRQVHARLGRALEDYGRADAETLATHFEEGGDARRAARYAARAAEHAQAALAFEHAARLYRRALSLEEGPPPGHPAQLQRLRLGLAEALGCAGRGQEAAQVYLSAAAAAPATEQLDLRWRAAEQLLMSGRTDEGVREMRTVLASIGMNMPATPRRAMVPLVWNRARLLLRGPGLRIRLRDPAAIPSAELSRIDICWSMAVGLAIVDPIRGADFQTRHILLALAAGDPYRVACALAAEAGFSAAGGSARRERTAWLVEQAEKLAVQAGHPNALGYAAFARGIADYLVGEWPSGLELCDRAEAVLRDRCAGVTWWIDSAQYFALECLWYLGEMNELGRRVTAQLELAQARGDIYASTNLQVGLPSMVWLARDDVASARRHIAEGMASWSAQGFHIQHEGKFHAEVQASLYVGDPAEAYRQVMATWPALRRSAIFTIQLGRVPGYSERARAALALAASLAPRSPLRRRLLADARWAVRHLVREHVPWADAFAALLRAGASCLSGDAIATDTELGAAISGFDATGMALYAHVARWRQGELMQGDAGAVLVARAQEWMRGQGIQRPERFVAMLAPGFERT